MSECPRGLVPKWFVINLFSRCGLFMHSIFKTYRLTTLAALSILNEYCCWGDNSTQATNSMKRYQAPQTISTKTKAGRLVRMLHNNDWQILRLRHMRAGSKRKNKDTVCLIIIQQNLLTLKRNKKVNNVNKIVTLQGIAMFSNYNQGKRMWIWVRHLALAQNQGQATLLKLLYTSERDYYCYCIVIWRKKAVRSRRW